MTRNLFLLHLMGIMTPAVAPRQEQTLSTGAKNMGVALAGKLPEGDFDLRLRLTWTGPGSVVDTVGLNAAKVGSYALNVLANGHLTFQVWDGASWIVIDSVQKAPKGQETAVRVVRRGELLHLEIGGVLSPSQRVPMPLTRQPAYVGDFPGDQSWAPRFDPNLGFVGKVTIAYVGLPSALPTSLVHDPTGQLSRDDISQFERTLMKLRQSGFPLGLTLLPSEDTEAKADVLWIWGDFLASGLLPREGGLLAFGKSSGWVYRRSTSLDSKLPLSRIQAEWQKVASESSQPRRMGTLLEALLATAAGLPSTTTVPPLTPSEPVVLAQKQIGPAGGTLETKGGISLTIPPGALAQTELIVVRSAPANAGQFFQITRKGSGHLTKPVRVAFTLPPGVDPTQVVAFHEIAPGVAMATPGQVNQVTNTLNIEINHFSVSGWIENFGTRNQIKVAGSAAGFFVGAGVVVKVFGAAAVATLGGITLPMWLIMGTGAWIGYLLSDPLYDSYRKGGMKGPLGGPGPFAILWDPALFTKRPQVWEVCEKQSGKILGYYSVDDFPSDPLTLQESQGSQTASLTGVVAPYRWADLRFNRVPADILTIAAQLQYARAWYTQAGFTVPAKPMTVLVQSMDNPGAFDGSMLELNPRGLIQGGEYADEVPSTIAHEYFHAVAKQQGYVDGVFVGKEEAMCVGFESLVFPGCDGFLRKEYNFSRVYPYFKNGLMGNGSGEGDSTPGRRGYLLWPWSKFLYHRYGVQALRDYGARTLPKPVLSQYFRAFAYSLLASDQALLDPIQVFNLEQRRMLSRTGWKDFSVLELVNSNMGGASVAPFDLGLSALAPSRPLSLRAFKVNVPRTPGGPLVIRRRHPDPSEEFVALQSRNVSDTSQILADTYTSGNLVGLPGGGVIRAKWIDSPTVSNLMGVVVIGTATDDTLGEGDSELLMYRLNPPSNLKLTALVPSGTTRLQWVLPQLGSPLKLTDCLMGYRLFGRTKAGKEELMGELYFDLPAGSVSQLPGKLSLSISADKTQIELPADQTKAYVALGLQSMEKVLRDEGKLVLSRIEWSPTTCTLVVDPPRFEATLNKPLTFTAKADFPPPGAKYTWKTSGKLLKDSGDKASVVFEKGGPATVTVELIDTTGKMVAMAVATGQAKIKETPKPTVTQPTTPKPTTTGTRRGVVLHLGGWAKYDRSFVNWGPNVWADFSLGSASWPIWIGSGSTWSITTQAGGGGDSEEHHVEAVQEQERLRELRWTCKGKGVRVENGKDRKFTYEWEIVMKDIPRDLSAATTTYSIRGIEDPNEHPEKVNPLARACITQITHRIKVDDGRVITLLDIDMTRRGRRFGPFYTTPFIEVKFLDEK